MLATISASAQLYGGFVITTKNANVSAGYLTNSNLELNISYALPLIKPVYGNISSINAGYKIGPVTAMIGVAHYTAKDFSDWDKGGYPTDVDKISGKYGIEVGKDIGLARILVSGYYCNQFYFGIGMRGFFR